MKNILEEISLVNKNVLGILGSRLNVSEAMSGKSNLGFHGIDQVGDFFVVIHPSKDSTLQDVLFKADIFDMVLQFRGGLAGKEIAGIYKTEEPARAEAVKLMKAIGINV